MYRVRVTQRPIKHCGYLIQPRATAIAANREAVCFIAVTLFISYLFISQADISTLAARIFAILVSFDRNLLRIFYN